MKTRLFILINVIFLIFSCGDQETNLFYKTNLDTVKGFYEYSKIGWRYRLPVKDPYQLLSSDNGLSWDFNTKKFPSVNNVKKLIFNDSLLVFYSEHTNSPLGMSEAWYVVNTNNKEEMWFTDERLYQKFLKKNRSKKLIEYGIDTVYKNFEKTLKLPKIWPSNYDVSKLEESETSKH